MPIPNSFSSCHHDKRPLSHYDSLVQLRAKKLLARADAKYGKGASLPGGKPGYDIIDYCLNEIAGLPRYADMIEHRVISLPNIGMDVTRRVIFLCNKLREDAIWRGALLERFRAELIEVHGCDLGEVEKIDVT